VRVMSNPVAGEAAAWDPVDPGPFRELAGTQFLRAEGDLAVVRARGGDEDVIRPGWLVIRPDGSKDGEAVFVSADNLGGPGKLFSAA